MKKLLSIVLALTIVSSMAISASAADARSITPRGKPENAVHFRNGANASGYMNAYATTTAAIKNGTKVTQYTYQNDGTQKFYTQSGYLKNATRTNLVVREIVNPAYPMETIIVLSDNLSNASFNFSSTSRGLTIQNASTGYYLTGSVYNNTSDTLGFSTINNYAYWSLI